MSRVRPLTEAELAAPEERRWPIVLVCEAQSKRMTDIFTYTATDDGTYWHDHSNDGGDIVCTGPFTIHRPICRCCPLTNGGAGHCGHTVCCWAATWKGD